MKAHRAYWGTLLVVFAVTSVSAGCGDGRELGGTLPSPWGCVTDCGGGGGNGQGAAPGSSDLKWATVFGDDKADQRTSRIVADKQGSLIMTGFFVDGLILGKTALVAPGPSEDVFVAKLNPDGTVLWAQSLGDARGKSVDLNRTRVPVAVNADGEIAVATRFFENVGFAGGDTVSGSGLIVALLDENGSEIWSLVLSDSGVDPGGVGIDAEGNVFVSGWHDGTMTVGTDDYPGAGVFIAKIDKDGTLAWVHDASCSCDSAVPALASLGLAVNAAGDAVAVGTHTDTLTIDDKKLAAGEQDAFAYMLDTNGVLKWAKAISGDSTDEGWSTAFDPSDGGVVISGSYLESLDFGNGIPPLEPSGGFAGFVAKLDAVDGASKWAISMGGSGHSPVHGVAVNAHGTVALVGDFSGTITLGGATHEAMGAGSAFVATLNPKGEVGWLTTHGLVGTAYGSGVTIDDNTNVSMCGEFVGDIQLLEEVKTAATLQIFVAQNGK